MILDTINNFLDRVFEGLNQIGVDVSGYELDHVCYRVETLEQYDAIKEALNKNGNLLLENEIGGRLIAKYKLDQPIKYKGREIFVVELPQPKGQEIKGWEHVEFVINESFDNFMKKYQNIKFDTSGINKSVNTDVLIRLDNFAVKFHQQSLEYVVTNLEK